MVGYRGCIQVASGRCLARVQSTALWQVRRECHRRDRREIGNWVGWPAGGPPRRRLPRQVRHLQRPVVGQRSLGRNHRFRPCAARLPKALELWPLRIRRIFGRMDEQRYRRGNVGSDHHPFARASIGKNCAAPRSRSPQARSTRSRGRGAARSRSASPVRPGRASRPTPATSPSASTSTSWSGGSPT